MQKNEWDRIDREREQRDKDDLSNSRRLKRLNLLSGDFELLQLPLDSTLNQINKTYKRLALLWHPDKFVR